MKTTLINAQQAHQVILDIWPKAKAYLMAGNRLTLEIKKEKRTNEQNRLLWAALTDISKQVDWYGEKLSPEDWKHVLSASLKKQRAVPGIDGGFVVLGLSTSKMDKSEMSELLDLAFSFGAQRGVVFSE